jgi:ATP-dependent helicase HrpB
MIQDAPDLPSAGILIFDEFHERSIHADLGLTLALDVQANLRPDLRIVIMSATLDGVGLGRILPEATTLSCPGRQYPIETVYLAFTPTGPFEITLRQAVLRALNETEGDILAFLPGRRELRRVRDALLDSRLPSGVHVHLLHGEADPQAQRAALSPAQHDERKIILSTSVAETSITLDGVRVVIDSGLSRIPRFDPRRGMTGLVTVPVSLATADQRRGRAGRQAAGVCYRLWTEDEHRKLDAYPIPDIGRAHV